MKEEGLVELYAKELRLPTFQNYAEVVRLAKEQGLDYGGFLLELLTRELTNRRHNQLQRRIKQARFPLIKFLDTFCFEHLPHLSEARLGIGYLRFHS